MARSRILFFEFAKFDGRADGDALGNVGSVRDVAILPEGQAVWTYPVHDTGVKRGFSGLIGSTPIRRVSQSFRVVPMLWRHGTGTAEGRRIWPSLQNIMKRYPLSTLHAYDARTGQYLFRATDEKSLREAAGVANVRITIVPEWKRRIAETDRRCELGRRANNSFVVQPLNERDIAKLEAAGFRFS